MEIKKVLDYGVDVNTDSRLLYPREVAINGSEDTVRHIIETFTDEYNAIIRNYNSYDRKIDNNMYDYYMWQNVEKINDKWVENWTYITLCGNENLGICAYIVSMYQLVEFINKLNAKEDIKANVIVKMNNISKLNDNVLEDISLDKMLKK